MPVYFFHLHHGHDAVLDQEGRELRGMAAIARAALTEARGIISADALLGRVDLTQYLDVVDAAQTMVYRLRFSDAVALTLPASADG